MSVIPAGLSWSTIHPSIDFETYSESGYVWDHEDEKWACLPNAPQSKKGLEVVSIAVYATHPSTEVLVFGYELADGTRGQWAPGMDPPQRLFDYIASGGKVAAWNSAFEWWIWNYVCVPKYGWPPLSQDSLVCTMARARAHALPGALGNAGIFLGIDSMLRKDDEGKRLLKKFSVPQNPTKKRRSRRIHPSDDLVDWARLCDYNLQDLVAESAVAAHVPDLSSDEERYWRDDQRINARGVAVDTPLIEACCRIVTDAIERYGAEMTQLTGGIKPTEVQQLLGWLHGMGVHMDALDEEAVDAALKRDLPPSARRALEIRGLVASASVKKVYLMRLQVSPWGRLHDLYTFHGARTGRPTGNGPQPTNLPKAGPHVYRCAACKHHFGKHHVSCPWCAAVRSPTLRLDEWSPDAMTDAIEVLMTNSLDCVEWFFGDALLTIAGCLRGVFIASPGHVLISSDYSAIEGVVIAALANEQWRLEIFRTHGKIYEMSAAKIMGIPFEDFAKHKAETGQHHPMRNKVGKIAELACFSPETQVLTHRGYVRIVDVQQADRLWDGVEWVSHGGVLPRGRRAVIKLDGIETTPRHMMLCGTSWLEAKQLASSADILCRALMTASANLPSWATPLRVLQASEFLSSALAGETLTPSNSAVCGADEALVAQGAGPKRVEQLESRTGNTRASFPTMRTVVDYSTALAPLSSDATTHATAGTRTTEREVFTSTRLGSTIGLRFLGIWSRLMDGITRPLKWIAGRWTKVTNRATCASARELRTCVTNEVCKPCNDESSNSKSVFDIAHAGPRNRFTIRTDNGHLIVHNCGFMGWIQAWRDFDGPGTDEEIKRNILAWRDASPAIVHFAGGQSRYFQPCDPFGCEGMAVKAIQNPGFEFPVIRLDGTPSGVSYLMFGGTLYCRLPSGKTITYHRARLDPPGDYEWRGLQIRYEGWNTNPKQGPVGWVTLSLYAGKCVENVVQTVAREIQMPAIARLEDDGYPVVLHTYDENVSEVPDDPQFTVEALEAKMNEMPAWATGWPIKASGGWRAKRYRKG